MNKRILILNTEVSGMNKYLFAELNKHGWELNIANVPFPKRLRYYAAIKGFRFLKREWRKQFYSHLGRLYKSSWCFQWRSQWCENQVINNIGKFDVILNISGMHSPFVDYNSRNNLRYAVLCSYTMALSKKWNEWLPYPREYDGWISLEEKLYSNATIILTTNDNVRHSLNKDYGVPLSKTAKIGYGLTLDTIPEYEKVYDGKTILYVGFDFKRKGGLDILEAFKIVRRSIVGAKLIIIGPSKNLYSINQEGVEFLGLIKDRNLVREYYRQASVFVMPSLCEPFGLTFLEAMAHKLPCIGSTIDAMPEIITDGETGYLIPPNSPYTLAEKLISILRDENMLRIMGQNAYLDSKARFSWSVVGENIDKELSRIICTSKGT